jgi:hypothetical protein
MIGKKKKKGRQVKKENANHHFASIETQQNRIDEEKFSL